MVLRAPVRIMCGDRWVEVLALLNTGFETDVPVVALPLDVAMRLGLRLGEKHVYFGPGSMTGEVYLAGEVTVEIESEGVKRSVKAQAIIEPRESEVIASDKLIEELGIVIDLKHKKWWLA